MSARVGSGRVGRVLLPLLIAAPVAVLMAGQLGLFSGQRPQDLGVSNGRLKAPSETRNSVSSQASLYPEHPQKMSAAIAALPMREGDPSTSMQTLVRVLEIQPGITIIEQTPDYVYAQAHTRWLGFIDDLEFWINPSAKQIEVRSASRLGQEDLDTNRQRIETIRASYVKR
jgi:uncharacterized protein (DUF1499 family)